MSYSWTFGSEGAELFFKVTATNDGNVTLSMLEGSMDLNALWFSNGDDISDGDTSLMGKDNSLNMNGTTDVWDSYAKTNDTGLKDGDLIEAGAVVDLTSYFDGLDLASLTLGIRATSVNGEGSVKLVSNAVDTFTLLSFEDGFTGWETTGLAETTDGYATEGLFSAKISTGVNLVSTGVSADSIAQFLGTSEGALETAAGGLDLTEGSAIKTTLDTVTGDKISFDYKWVSDEFLNFDDISFLVTENGTEVITEIASFLEDGAMSEGTIEFTATTTGTMNLGIGILDALDSVVNSTVYIDNLIVT